MKRSPLRLWLATACALGLAGLWQFFPLADAAGRLEALPVKGLFFNARPMSLNPAEHEIYGRARVLKRLVRMRGQAFTLTVIDGTRNRHAIHDPLYCFRGAGWEVQVATDVNLPHGTARAVSLRQAGKQGEAVYWFSNGRQAFASATRYWTETTLCRLTLGRSGDEPVLVILTSVDDRAPDWGGILAIWPELMQL
jgi:hypothetical protein